MTVRVIDSNEKRLTAEQVEKLNIWNSTMSHVCASVLERIRMDKVTTPVSLKNNQECDSISSASI